MRALGLACSPRVGGNTDIMLDKALEGVEAKGGTVEKLYTTAFNINPCLACNSCFKTGECIQQDDMQLIYPKLLSYEGVILAAPIFSMNLSAQAKIFIDRLQCCWSKKYVLKQNTVPEDIRGSRRGLWLSAAGFDREDVFEPALATVKYFFAMLEIKNWDRVTYHNVDDKGEIEDVPGALDACFTAGEELATGVDQA
ncbi:MAG: flavodoxin family protein [Actinobacteria bacterium]|nr:flavodoxin family protein [Actinomycetota bacterium]